MFAWKQKNVFARKYVLKLIINGKLPFFIGIMHHDKAPLGRVFIYILFFKY